MGQGGVWEGRSPGHSASHPPSRSGGCQPLGPSTPGDASPWVCSLLLPAARLPRHLLWPGQGVVEHVHLLLQQVQTSVSSTGGRTEGNIPTHPAGREVHAEGRNARPFAAVTTWDLVHGMRWGEGVHGLMGGSPMPEGRQMQTHLERVTLKGSAA